MQVSAAEFVAVIASLIAIAGGSLLFAFDANERKRQAESALKDAQEKILKLDTEIAALNRRVDAIKPDKSDEFTKPIPYNKTYLA